MIKHFHAHVYFDPLTRDTAAGVYARLTAAFPLDSRWRDAPIGPHPRPNFRIRFSTDEFGAIVPWLMLHRDGLSVLVHPDTGDRVADHTGHALWLGKRVPLDIGFLRRPDDAS